MQKYKIKLKESDLESNVTNKRREKEIREK